MDRLRSKQSTGDARIAILNSIREHLAVSTRHDVSDAQTEFQTDSGGQHTLNAVGAVSADVHSENGSPVGIFCERLESVGGHCVTVSGDSEAVCALIDVIAQLQTSSMFGRRIALSDAPLLFQLMDRAELSGYELAVTPGSADMFGYDIGISTAQAAIAETGTLVLESDSERHRLVSLLPPVHIAVVNAADICPTLGAALNRVRNDRIEMSRAITFITGPSRTADIELTLAIGVHGPKELYVIINEQRSDVP